MGAKGRLREKVAIIIFVLIVVIGAQKNDYYKGIF
jgi:hypothetical protein